MSACEPVSYVFDVPGEAKVKKRARVTARGAYTPDETRSWERTVGLVALAAGVRPIKGDVRLEVWLGGKLPGDADNYLKAICDGLNRIAYADDRQIKAVLAVKLCGASQMCRIRVGQLEQGWESRVQIPEVGP